MRHAVIAFRDNGHAKIKSFYAGCEAAGYRPGNIASMTSLGRGDLFICWNRYIGIDHHCRVAEKRGATILVAENGYVGNDPTGRQYFALAVGHHNGAGSWRIGDPGRWSDMGVDVRPWRRGGHSILVLPQRGIGENGVRMPPHWTECTKSKLRAFTNRRVIVRPHPGRLKIPLEPAFKDVWAAVTWGSGAAVKALAQGIPVFYDFPNWVGASAAKPLFSKPGVLTNLEDPFLGDRLPMFERLAWCQFSLAEIETGFPIKWLTS